ncbi:12437_t:CDS:2 [Funneliformis geosporum]|nr:12437_t:CDS:2 [Funneliformis geosporum]
MSASKQNKEISELDQYSECNNEILSYPLKVITILSNQKSPSQLGEISALSDRINKNFILSSPILQMDGIKDIGSQQPKII